MPFPTENFFSNEDRQVSFRRLLRRVFLEDWLIKVIALFITVTLWLGVTGLRAPKSARLSGIPLNLRVSNEIEITNSPVQEVNLVITGDKSRIDQLNQRDLVVSLDLSEVQTGERLVQLTPENVLVELPTGVRVTEIQPDRIALRLEAVEEREITVKAEIEGSIAENYEIYSKTVLPNKVRVRGPASFIKSLDSISTEKVNLENRQADFTVRQVALNVVNPKVTVLDTAVDIFFRVGEKRVERLFIVPVKIEIGSKTATVVLYGGRLILESLKPENLSVEIAKNEAGEDSLKLSLPADIQDQVEIKKLKIN